MASKDRRSVSGVPVFSINYSNARPRLRGFLFKLETLETPTLKSLVILELTKQMPEHPIVCADCNDRNPVGVDRKSGARNNEPHINGHTIQNCVGLDFAHEKTPGAKKGGETRQGLQSHQHKGEHHATSAPRLLCIMWFVTRQGCSSRAFHRGDFVDHALGCGTGNQRFFY